VVNHVDHLILFGEAAELIESEIKKVSSSCQGVLQSMNRSTTMSDAVQIAADLVQPGDVVLLSPGGTSFDEFIDFEERGRCFEILVNELP
jgi:UDP-N-acetylmuramoylalanine--D-glutamate ligase